MWRAPRSPKPAPRGGGAPPTGEAPRPTTQGVYGADGLPSGGALPQSSLGGPSSQGSLGACLPSGGVTPQASLLASPVPGASPMDGSPPRHRPVSARQFSPPRHVRVSPRPTRVNPSLRVAVCIDGASPTQRDGGLRGGWLAGGSPSRIPTRLRGIVRFPALALLFTLVPHPTASHTAEVVFYK